MASTRLPGKVLREIGGKPMIQHQIDRIHAAGLPLMIATSLSDSDTMLASYLERARIPFFRGSELDVLDRFYQCARIAGAEIIVRITADCPLIDGGLVHSAIRTYREANNRKLYLSNVVKRTFPRGFDFEVFTFEMLEEAHRNADVPTQREHVTPYFRAHPDRFSSMDVTHSYDASTYRLTVDEPADFELLRELIENYRCEQLPASDIIDLLQREPRLAAINAHVEQKRELGTT